jgi:hypothetical protein
VIQLEYSRTFEISEATGNEMLTNHQMTAFCGAMSIGNPHNISTLYALVLFAALGCGAVIIPASIIAQIICPPELIATITAITLAIRYLGGAVAFTGKPPLVLGTWYNPASDKFWVLTISQPTTTRWRANMQPTRRR